MTTEANERQRIIMLRELLQMSQTEFSRKIGISQGALSQIESGRSRLSMETLKNLTKAFNVNCNWLVIGDGDIFYQEHGFKKKAKEKNGIPLVDVKARAGYIKSYDSINFINSLDTYHLPGFEDHLKYRMFEIEGESMVPTFFSSEIVIAKKNKNKENFKTDKLSVFLTKNSLIAKRAKRSADSPDLLKIISDNPEFSNFDLHRNEVVEIWEIKGKITKKLLQNYVFDFHRLTNMEKDIKYLQSKMSTLLGHQNPGADQN